MKLILQAVDALNQVMLQLVIGLLQNGLLLRVPRHIPDTLALGGFQFLLCVQQQGFQILRSAFRFTYVLLLVGKVGVETLQHIGGVVLYLFEIQLHQLVQLVHPDVVAGAAGQSTAVIGAAGVGRAQIPAAHGKHGTAAVTALQKAGVHIVIDFLPAVVVGRALFPQGANGGKGAVVDDGLMVVFNNNVFQLIPLDILTVDFGTGVLALPECADVKIIVQNTLHRDNSPVLFRCAAGFLPLRLFAKLL